MAISESGTYPSQFAQSRGHTLFRWDIREEQVTDPVTGEVTTKYVYKEVAIDGKVTKAKVLAAMQADELEQNSGDASDAAAQYEDAKGTIDLSNIADLTYDQLATYIDNNVTDLASAKAFLKQLAAVVLAMLKRQNWG